MYSFFLDDEEHGQRIANIELIDKLFLGIYIIEFLLKVIALGIHIYFSDN